MTLYRRMPRPSFARSNIVPFRASVIAARKFLHVSGSFRGPRPRTEEGRRNAERRTLVTAAAYFPDCRETEAHGNASQRPAAATSSSLGPCFRHRREQARHPGRLSPTLRLYPPAIKGRPSIVGSGGYPRPPESTLARHGRGRRIRPAWVTPPRPKLSLCPTSVTPLEAPPREQDGWDYKAGGKGEDRYTFTSS
jgi:hypothetical protein